MLSQKRVLQLICLLTIFLVGCLPLRTGVTGELIDVDYDSSAKCSTIETTDGLFLIFSEDVKQFLDIWLSPGVAIVDMDVAYYGGPCSEISHLTILIVSQ